MADILWWHHIWTTLQLTMALDISTPEIFLKTQQDIQRIPLSLDQTIFLKDSVCWIINLTHLLLCKIAAISQTIFSDAFF